MLSHSSQHCIVNYDWNLRRSGTPEGVFSNSTIRGEYKKKKEKKINEKSHFPVLFSVISHTRTIFSRWLYFYTCSCFFFFGFLGAVREWGFIVPKKSAEKWGIFFRPRGLERGLECWENEEEIGGWEIWGIDVVDCLGVRLLGERQGGTS